MGIMVKALVGSENSTFAPSGWFMHAWSHIPTFRNVDGFAGSVCVHACIAHGVILRSR